MIKEKNQKSKKLRIKLKTSIHDKKKIKHVEFFKLFFYIKKLINITRKTYPCI
jgi:hypothetical protein